MGLLTTNRPLRLAYVEDVKSDFDAFVESFRTHGFLNDVDWYETGEAFILEMTSPFPRRPDIALIDLTLSPKGITGTETMQILKRNEQLQDMPLFIVTGSDLVIADSVARLVGAAHRCQKPLRTPNLLEMLLDINRHGRRFGLQLVALETVNGGVVV